MPKYRSLHFILLGLWVGLGVVLAPAQPMPNMSDGSRGATAEMAGQGPHAHAEPTPQHDDSTPEHSPRCALCLVGAGVLLVQVSLPSHSSRLHVISETARPLPKPRRFRLYRSRAPPLRTLFSAGAVESNLRPGNPTPL